MPSSKKDKRNNGSADKEDSKSSSSGHTESRARIFYKKPSSAGVEKKRTSGVSSKRTPDGHSGGDRRGNKTPTTTKSSTKNVVEKRAKAKFYQSQYHANASWYALKDSVKEHLEYALQKYPVDEEIELIASVDQAVMKVFPPTQIEAKLHKKIEAKRLKDLKQASVQAGGARAKVLVKPQFSRIALDKIWLFCAKRAESLLEKAAEYTAARKQQTTTVADLLLAYEDMNKMIAPPSYF